MACRPRRSWLGPEPDRRNLQDRPRLSSQIEATPTTSDHDPALVRHLTSRPNRVLSASKARERFNGTAFATVAQRNPWHERSTAAPAPMGLAHAPQHRRSPCGPERNKEG